MSVSDLTMECPYFYTKKNVRRNGPWIGFKEFSNVLCSHSLSASFIYFRGMHANYLFDRGQVNDTVGGDVGREKECRKVGDDSWLLLLSESIYIYLVQGARQR